MIEFYRNQEARKKFTQFPVLVPVKRDQPLWEHGLLHLDQHGISYLPTVRFRRAYIIILVWFLLTLFVPFSYGFMGNVIHYILLSVYIIVIIYFCYCTVKVIMRAHKLERVAKTSGLESVQALDGKWHVSWEEVKSIDMYDFRHRPPYAFILTTINNEKYNLTLSRSKSVLGIVHPQEAKDMVDCVINRHFPEKLES